MFSFVWLTASTEGVMKEEIAESISTPGALLDWIVAYKVCIYTCMYMSVQER